jgi:hypothetical protein
VATLEALSGGALLLIVLLDVFLTILYARLESSFLAMHVARVTARAFVRISWWLGARRARFVSLCGPTALVVVVALWFSLLTFGSALIVHPALTREIRNPTLQGGTDFFTALYVAGVSLSIVGSSGYEPTTPGYRLLFLAESGIGMSLMSLIIAYLVQLYSALLRRNSVALKMHALCEGKADGAELVCRAGPRGHFDSGLSVFAELASDLAYVRESLHFYPLLLYFRFEEAEYSVSRMVHVALDAASLTMSSLEQKSLGWVADSAAVTQFWRAALLILHTLIQDLDEHSSTKDPPSPETLAFWRARYQEALRRLRAAGIPTIADDEHGFRRYSELRARWDNFVKTLAPKLAYDMSEIDRPLNATRRVGEPP